LAPDLAPNPDADADFILANADRLITVTVRCVVSFGLADGLNELLLKSTTDRHDPWRQPVVGFQRDGLLMAALRAAVLLDTGPKLVSFRAVNNRLMLPGVEAALLQALEDRHGPDVAMSTRTELIAEFRKVHAEIDGKVYERLWHFRSRGIAHLTTEKLLKLVTFDELKTMVGIIGRLAVMLRDLCQSQLAFDPDMQQEYAELAKKAIKPPRGGIS
jgi:hypothetical protein